MSGKIPANADRYRANGCVDRRQLTEALAIVKKKKSCATTQIKFHRITSNQVFQIWVVLSFYASLGGIPWLPCLSSMVVMESYTQSYGKSVWKEAHLVAAHSWSPPKSTHGSKFFQNGLRCVYIDSGMLWHCAVMSCGKIWIKRIK